MKMVMEDDDFALDVLEVMISKPAIGVAQLRELDRLLSEAHSAYRLREDGRAIEMRDLPEVKEQVQAVVNAAADSPGEHLAAAYNSANGRTTDTEKAYARAIKAVEAAVRPIISPNDTAATLTKMIIAVRDKPAKWTFGLVDHRDAKSPSAPAADGIGVVLDLMRLLAYGQQERHGDSAPIVENTREEARAAVMVATTLVDWATTGTFRLA